MARILRGGLIQVSNPINDESKPIEEIQKAALDKHLPFIDQAGEQGVIEAKEKGTEYCQHKNPA